MDIEDDFGFRLRDGGSGHHSHTKTDTAADDEPANSITTDTADVVVGPTDLQNETDDEAVVIDENTADETENEEDKDDDVPTLPPSGLKVVL